MPQPYNLTNVTNSTDLLGLFQATNQIADNSFGVMILLLIWFVIFIRLKMYTSKSAMFAASFITTLVAIMLFLVGMISQTVLMMVIVLLAISFVIVTMDL
jgi:hypothetical protein